MNVGVTGRETGVGIELTVAVVLMLLRPSVEVDSRDCGLINPEDCAFLIEWTRVVRRPESIFEQLGRWQRNICREIGGAPTLIPFEC
jgi:hypothetical protein